MLGFVKDQQHLAMAEVKTQIPENPVDGAHSDRPTALGHPLHQVQRADSLTNIDVVSSPALSVLGDLRAVQLCDQMLQYVGLLGSRGAVEVIGSPMIQDVVHLHLDDFARKAELRNAQVEHSAGDRCGIIKM